VASGLRLVADRDSATPSPNSSLPADLPRLCYVRVWHRVSMAVERRLDRRVPELGLDHFGCELWAIKGWRTVWRRSDAAKLCAPEHSPQFR
jgi:hypothetical protein